MLAAPIPTNETERLAELRALDILDTAPEERFDRLVRLARLVFGVPIAYVAMIDADRQWFKSRCGLDALWTPRDISFCGHAILGDEPLIIQDAREDARFRDNPMVRDTPFVRFYAGFPLKGPAGYNVGTFCLVDREPRTLSEREQRIFADIAQLAQHELRMVDVIRVQHQLIETRNDLARTQARLSAELAEAAAYLRSLLPPRLERPIRSDWRFLSSSQLGGDLFGHHFLDDHHLAIYLLDACGHGVGASLLAISAHTALRRQTLPNVDFKDPAQVLSALNSAFPMEEHGNKFFTIWYGVLNLATRDLAYAAGGHPPALILHDCNGDAERLCASNPVIGVVPDLEFKASFRTIAPDSRLYVYSDGVFEVRSPAGQMLRIDGLATTLANAQKADDRLDHAVGAIRAFQEQDEFADDFSLLEFELPGSA